MNVSKTMPPDRGHLSTEHRHEASKDMDTLDTASCIALMTGDHRRVTDAVAGAAPDLATFIDAIVPRMRQGGRLIYIGAGTSGRLGVLDASECPPTFQTDPNQVVGVIAGGDAALRRSSEAKEDDPDGAREALDALALTTDDALLGIAAGGTTPYVLGALRLARERGVVTGLLTCAPQTPAPDGCDHLILLDTGPELLTGSTRLKAGSATKLALNIISTVTFIKLGKVYTNLMVDLRATNDKLTDRAIRILIELCPHLTRDEALDLLHRAEGKLKVAILMKKLDVDRVDAERLLDEFQGHLHPVLAHNVHPPGGGAGALSSPEE